MKLLKTITPLPRRVIVFLCLFFIISGIIGPRIISGGILFRDGFAIYGGVGKALIFGLIAFILLIRRRDKSEIVISPWRLCLLNWIVLSLGTLMIAWISIGNLLVGRQDIQDILGAHIGLLLSVTCALVACIGPKNIGVLWQRYRREITGAIILAIGFYAFLEIVYALWQPLASIVLLSVEALLTTTGLHAIFVPPNTLMFDKFGITVAEYCSGIESIALFSGLYLIVGLLDWRRLHKVRYFVIFPCALLILCGLNIVRVFGLILAGYYINPEIAFSLFHTYAGMVFFILYSAIFWAIAYKYLIIQPRKESPL